MHIETLADVEQVLNGLKPVVVIPNLQSPENMRELMDFLGNPQEQYKVVHVAGTSGKTSTACYTAALLLAAGKRVGLNISPHAETINERVQLQGRPMPEADFCREFTRFYSLVASSGIALNYFQFITAFAFWEFAEQRVEYAVVEVGIGGLADSTNVVTRQDKICVITDIGYAHTNILGRTLPEIAANKAGIIQLHNMVFCRQQGEEILQPVRDRAQRKHAEVRFVDSVSEYGFLPPFQQRNFAMAEVAAQFALERDGLPPLEPTMIEQAAHTVIPARLEVHQLPGGKTLVLDAAHNPQKLQAVMESLRQQFPGQEVAVLFAPTTGPETFYDGMVQQLLKTPVLLTGYPAEPSGRYGSADPHRLLKRLQQAGGSGKVYPDAAQAFQALTQRTEPVLLVTGSFYILNRVRPLLHG